MEKIFFFGKDRWNKIRMMDQYKHIYLPVLTFSDRLSTYPEGCFQRLTFETAVRHGMGQHLTLKGKEKAQDLRWHGISNFKYYVLNIFLDICGIHNIRGRDPDTALFGYS
jgi:hypothetical protein